MKTANLLQLEIKSALGRLRAVLLRLGLTFLIGSPLVFIELPVSVRAVGLTMMVAFIGFFGAAVAAARALDRGELAYLETLPLPRWLTAVDKILAGAFIDLLQIAPLMALLLLISPAEAVLVDILNLAATLVVVICLQNGLGHGLGRLLKSNAEVHLAGALVVGLLAFTAGLFPVPEALAGAVGMLAEFNPLAWLKMSLTTGLTGPGGNGLAWLMVIPAVVMAFCFALRALNYRPGEGNAKNK